MSNFTQDPHAEEAPAGRLSDEELGEIGARAALKVLLAGGDSSSAVVVDPNHKEFEFDKPERTAFAAAVAAEVRKQDAQQMRLWQISANEREERLEKELETLRAELAKRDERLALLTPRPCSVKPTEEDGDEEGRVFMLWDDRSSGLFALESVRPGDDAFWLPGNLARIAPELVPKVETPEEIERREFEAYYAEADPRTPQNPFEKEAAWKAWQAARAAKEGKV